MARRSEHSLEEIKLMVLDAAEEIVQKEGFSALKIRRIVADIGYTVGSVYMVFANMDDLHVQLKTRTLLSLLHACESAHDIDSLAQEYVLFVQRERGVWGMLFTHQSEKILAADKDYELAQIALSHCLVQYLQRLNPMRDESEVYQASEALMLAIQGGCLPFLWEKGVERKTIEGRLSLLLVSFLRGWQLEGNKQSADKNKPT